MKQNQTAVLQHPTQTRHHQHHHHHRIGIVWIKTAINFFLTSLRWHWQTRTTQCRASIVVYTDVDGQCDKLVTDDGHQFTTLTVHLSWQPLRRSAATTTQTCFFHIRRLRQIRRLLRRDVTAKLVPAFVISWLDYGNAVLAGLPQSTIAPLQRALNAAARLVLGLRPRDHVTAALIDLHWLPVAARVEYKLCTLVYQSDTGIGNAPTYITDMLQPVSDLDRLTQLRSAWKGDLVVPRTRLKLGERAFRVAAPWLWNELPPDIRKSSTLATFKKHLKTFLFCKHYGLVLEQ